MRRGPPLLVPLDRSPLAEQAVRQAAAIARAAGAAMDLVLVHVPGPFERPGATPWNVQETQAERRYLESFLAELSSGTPLAATHDVVRGDAADMICVRASEVGADLIVMTSHGRTGFSRAWFGSVTNGVLRHSAVPVLVLRPLEGKSWRDTASRLPERLLVPLDGSALSAAILPSAIALAMCGSARVTLVTIVQPVSMVIPELETPRRLPPVVLDYAATERVASDATEHLTTLAASLRAEHGTVVEAHVVIAANVAQAILGFARTHDADAIAMATHGRGVSRLFLGSVADKVLRAAELPTLLYRPAKVGVEETVDATIGHHAMTTRLELVPAFRIEPAKLSQS